MPHPLTHIYPKRGAMGSFGSGRRQCFRVVLVPNATHIDDRYNPRGVAWIVLRVVGDNGSQSAGVLRCFPSQASEPNGGACREVSKTHEGVEHVRSTYGARTEHVRSTYEARTEHVGKNHEKRTSP